MPVVNAESRLEISAVPKSLTPFSSEEAAATLITRLEQVPTSRLFVHARVVMGSATFFDAFNALSIAFVLPILVPLWHVTAPEVGIMIGASYVGQIIGALAFSWAAERYGRVPCAAAATAIYALMSLACAAAWSFNILLLFRFIQGIGVGGEMPIAATYISELSKARGRGRFFMLYEMIFPIGLMVTGQVGAVLVPLMGWQIMFLIGGIPGLLIALLLLRLPESARWLIGKGRFAEAEAVVMRIEAAADKAAAAKADALPPATMPAAAPGPTALPRQVERIAVACLSQAHAGRLGFVGFRVSHCQQPQQLAAHALHDRVSPRRSRGTAGGLDDQRRAGGGGISVCPVDRPYWPQILVDGRLRAWRGDACGAGARRHAECRVGDRIQHA